MKLYLSTVFSGGKPEWQQVMRPDETQRAAQPLPEDYMYGGQPVEPGEVFNGKLPCFARPEVREYFRQMVVKKRATAGGRAGLRHGRLPELLTAATARCARRSWRPTGRPIPAVTEQRAAAIVAEDTIVSFINDMAGVARQTNPQIALTIHIYPWFSPKPYYGHETGP